MKHIIHLITFIVFSGILSCTTKDDSTIFDSDKLQGKYQVDLTEFIENQFKAKKDDNGWEKLGKNIVMQVAKLAFYTGTAEITFYDNNEGEYFIDGLLINLLRDDSTQKKPYKFVYEIKNDSLLFIKVKNKYIQKGVIKTKNNNYDFFQLIIYENGNYQETIKLTKIYK